MYDINEIKNQQISELISRYVELKQNGTEYIACCPLHGERTPSFTVNDQKGFYHCFGCGSNGDAIDFVMEYTGVDFKQACEDLGAGRVAGADVVARKPIERISYYDGYTPSNIPPGPLPNPVKAINPKREHKLSTLRWSDCYAYGSSGYVLRMEIDGKKITPTVRWCNDQWVMYPFADSGRHLYLKENLQPGTQVLIPEGEKAADHVSEIIAGSQKLSVVSWAGGTNGIDKSDWSCLAGRSIVLLPDNDEGGLKAMAWLREHLTDLGCQVKTVIPESDKPKGWDVADQKWSLKELLAWCKNNVGELPEPKPKTDNVVPILPSVPVPPVEQYENDDSTTAQSMADLGFINWPHSKPNGKPKATLENFLTMMSALNITPRYNLVSKEVEINIPSASFTLDNAANATLAVLKSYAAKFDYPTEPVKEYLLAAADKNPYNPVKSWIESKPWDGADRINELTSTMDPECHDTALFLLTRWLLSAVAAVYRPNGVSAGGVLVLQGKQGLGKTSWFWKLVDGNREWGKESAILNPADKDSVKQCISYWIVELGELDATFRKSDIAALKGFITRDHDEFRRAYAPCESRYPRRTVFFASVNPKGYLHDDTGNRRFWTVPCGEKMNFNHNIDIQQVWAQILTYYNAGESWHLSRDESERLESVNDDHHNADPIEELITRYYDLSTPHTERMTATDVLISIGYDKPNKLQTREAGAALRRLLGVDGPKKSNGVRFYTLPQKMHGV